MTEKKYKCECCGYETDTITIGCIRIGCVKCGKPNALGHHIDYDRPYDVVWLCPLHHSQLHRQIEGGQRKGDDESQGTKLSPSKSKEKK